MNFMDKYAEAKAERKSVLCVGLDPASTYMREGKHAISEQYFESEGEIDGMMNFCLGIVEDVAESAFALKANAQYTLPFGLAHHKKLNNAIHGHGMLSIFDLKLGDIGSSNEAAVYWIRQSGYDALTFTPFAGNIQEATTAAHVRWLGIFVLTLMTNPEAVYFMRECSIAGKRGYEWIAGEIKKAGADGAVVGATNTTPEELKTIRSLIGDDKILLVPGVGAQGGDAEKMLRAGGKNILINVGRDIIYSSSPKKAAKKYNDEFNKLIKW
ncbi:MAG: orotidine-5'-phosphate decarboxylase [Candidatus Micrarchaeota archaeon]